MKEILYLILIDYAFPIFAIIVMILIIILLIESVINWW